MTQGEIIENLRRCPRYPGCSASICPFDLEVNIRIAGCEDFCPFRINKKSKDEKGIVTLIGKSILEVIPESNLKMLNKRNQKRWSELKNNKINYEDKKRRV